MASLTFSIDTQATGPLSLAFDLTEEDAQRIFAAIVGGAAPVTDVRTVPDPENPEQTIVERTQRPCTLGEALQNKVNVIVNGLRGETVSYEEVQAKAAVVIPAAPELNPQA